MLPYGSVLSTVGTLILAVFGGLGGMANPLPFSCIGKSSTHGCSRHDMEKLA